MKGKITATAIIVLLIITTLGVINTQAANSGPQNPAFDEEVRINELTMVWNLDPPGRPVEAGFLYASAKAGLYTGTGVIVGYKNVRVSLDIQSQTITSGWAYVHIQEGALGPEIIHTPIGDIQIGVWSLVSMTGSASCWYMDIETLEVRIYGASDTWTVGDISKPTAPTIHAQNALTFTEQFDGVLKTYIQQLPNDAFKNNPDQRKNAFSEKIDEITEYAQNGDYQDVVNKLQNDIRAKMDGSVDGNPNNDWIVNSEIQTELVAVIDWALEGYQNMLTETAE